jgi:hypothetical protein
VRQLAPLGSDAKASERRFGICDAQMPVRWVVTQAHCPWYSVSLRSVMIPIDTLASRKRMRHEERSLEWNSRDRLVC